VSNVGGHYEMARERQRGLLREAEERRLVRELKEVRGEWGSLVEGATRGVWRVSAGGWVLELRKAAQGAR
jgi:hypothetical protein